MLQLSALELGCFAIVFFAGFLATWSGFLLGGAVGCLVNAGKHARLAGKQAAGMRGAAQQGVSGLLPSSLTAISSSHSNPQSDESWLRVSDGRTDCKRIFGLVDGALSLRAMMESARKEANR
jgi:hypothetical protein